MARYNITLPDEVIAAADQKAKEFGLSRSAFIASAIQFKIQYDALVSQLPAMLEFIRDLRAGGVPVSSVDSCGFDSAPIGADDGGRA